MGGGDDPLVHAEGRLEGMLRGRSHFGDDGARYPIVQAAARLDEICVEMIAEIEHLRRVWDGGEGQR